MPRLASPATASPAIVATARGRNSGSSAASAAKATNRPLPVMALRKSGPPPPGPGEDTRMATAMMIGTTASTPRPARLRRRPKMMASSEARNRSDGRELLRRRDVQHLSR